MTCRKVLTIITLTFFLLLLSSCKKTGRGDIIEAESPHNDTVNITWALSVDKTVADAETVSARVSEFFSGIHVDFQYTERSIWNDKINARITSGDIPDIIYRDEKRALTYYAIQEFICELPVQTIEKYSPNIYAACDAFGDEIWLATHVNGKNYGLPLIESGAEKLYCNHWRADLLERLGVFKIPETIEEAEAVFELAKHTDLSGTGKFDTYGLTFRGKDQTADLFCSIFAAFGTYPNKWMFDDEGRLVLGIVTDEAADAVALLAKWYEKGYIDPSFITTDAAMYDQKVADGNILLNTFVTIESILPPDSKFIRLASVANPNARFVPAPPLKGPDGSCGYNIPNVTGSSVCFGKHLEADLQKMNTCLEIVDFIYSDTRDAENVLFGEKGVEWDQDPETNGYINLNEGAPDKDRLLGFYFSGVPGRREKFSHPLAKEYASYALYGTLKPGEDFIDDPSLNISPEMRSIREESDRNLYKGILDIITQNRPAEDFEVVRTEWYASGGRRVSEEINRVYTESLSGN